MPLTRRGFLKLLMGQAAVLAYPTVLERNWLNFNRCDIYLPRLPQAFDGFRIVHLTDIHYGAYTSIDVIQLAIAWANCARQDITVLTGDYVYAEHTRREIDLIWPMLRTLRAPLGVYAVLGNHDHWADGAASIEALHSSGFDLRHKARLFERDDQRLWLGGTGDFWEDTQSVDKIFAGTPDGDCKIVLAHNPDSADEPFQTSVDLMLSGHTHGGQAILPGYGSVALPVENKRYDYGLIQTPRFPLFISRGVGCAAYPGRLNCAPEVVLLTLRCAA